MSRMVRPRFWLETVAAVVASAVGVLTIVWPRWIEGLFGVDPDHGSGALEWATVAFLAASALVLTISALVEWRHGAMAGVAQGG